MNKAIILLCLIVPTTALLAWGEKGHTIANEAATFAVPYEMPAFFHDAYPGLVYLGYDPDRWRGSGDSLAVAAQDHFLDYEYAAPLETLPPSRYDFMELMRTSGLQRQFGIGNDTTGFVAWRVAELCELLTRQWQLWRAADNLVVRRQIEQNIIHLSGILGHYVADSANPHHTTKEYNGWTAPNPKGYRYDCETHSRFESWFVTKRLSVEVVLPYMSVPQRRDDYFAEAVGFIHTSNGQLETLYALDRDGAFDGEGTDEGVEFAAQRLATGASWLRDLWWSTFLSGTAEPSRRRR